MSRRLHSLFAACAIAAMPAAALAHHGWSSYDESKPITLTGPLNSVTWGNAHGTAKMNWRGGSWDVVLAPTTRMEARGLAKNEIDAGQRISLTGYVRKDGTPEMRVERVFVNDKKVELR
ncbi:DUF6152 family protein [Sphingomonas baiyangensis]|uniref:DUF5666 domain-containing protein n=1 Tax=Sphingomonas baiyangensis TaxID=2572576 RepID=A0A4U1L6B9_9SPHN|nr:DUF6152 family protein [Sphingomonas baiyangensis]TKD51766.1 hypothetical protein FBR43_14135 [Sphingomonas baiyangensis]